MEIHHDLKGAIGIARSLLEALPKDDPELIEIYTLFLDRLIQNTRALEEIAGGSP